MKFIWLYFISAILLCLFANAQTDSNYFDKKLAQLQQENIYIHFDKQNYNPGETIWLKAYFTTGGIVDTKSTGIKIEIINSAGELVSQKIFPVLSGVANGNINLSANLPTGNYLFRAYTKWMMQFDSKDFYQRNLIIGVPSSKKNTINTKLNISFFPEGGNLIAGVLNLVGFTSTSNDGLPLESSGIIVSSTGDTITQFSTSVEGMGKFGLIPKAGERYKAIVTESVNINEINLPTVQEKGIALQIATTNAGKMFAINAVNIQPAYIVGYRDNELIFKTSFPENKSVFTGTVPTKNLSSGIITIAVFDKENHVLAQRQTFVNNQEFLIKPILITDTVSTAYREKNVYTLSLPDSLEGNFSISVTNAYKDLSTENNNIANSLLLHNKLEQSFFTNSINLNEAVKLVEQKTDLLLLTQKSRFTDFSRLQDTKELKTTIAENYISLKGTATTNGKKILPETDLTFIVQTKDSSINYLLATTDKEGNFILDGLLFEDTATVFYQNNSKKNKDKSIEIINSSTSISKDFQAPINLANWHQIAAYLPEPVKPSQADIGGIDTSGTTITGVTVIAAKKKSPTQLLDERYSRGMFSGMSRSVIDFVNNPPPLGGNIFQYLQGRFSYLTITGTMPNYKVQYRNTMSLSGGPIYMALFLDEFPADASVLLTVPMQNIAMIKIFTNGFSGSDGVGGALAVYTKKFEDGFTDNNLTKLNKISLPGYSTAEIFNSPVYKSTKESFIKKDNRTTLYWNPSVIINSDNKTFPISFYNTDNCKKFRITIQGITSSGKFVYLEKIIE
jgi:hypothetical protein